MSNKRIIFLTGEGIGNVIQTFPTLRTLKEVSGFEVDFCHLFGTYSVDSLHVPYVNRVLTSSELSLINPDNYVGKVSTIWTSNYLSAGNLHKIPLLTKISPLSTDRSEVDTYLDIARYLGAKEEQLLWEAYCNVKPAKKKYDVVIANGYNRYGSSKWEVKSYPYYIKLVKILKDAGYSVASVGSRLEYIKGTEDETGLDLFGEYSTASIIKASKCFVSNDTGTYHLANFIKQPNIVIFTATSEVKNYDPKFHKYSKILCRDDLVCRPCQKNRLWINKCNDWECRKILPELVFENIQKIIM